MMSPHRSRPDVVQQPGHHRDKLNSIRDSLRPFEQPAEPLPGPSCIVLNNNGHLGPSTSFPIQGSNGTTTNGSTVSADDKQTHMINAMTKLGFDKESAYYALQLVNFSSLVDAANVLNHIKRDIALNHSPYLSSTPVTTSMTYIGTSIASSKSSGVTSGRSTTYLNVGSDSRGSSRSESPTQPPPLPVLAPPRVDVHRSHAKISLKQTTSMGPSMIVRTPPQRSTITSAPSAPLQPSSTVIAIDRNAAQQRPPQRREGGGGPVIRTTIMDKPRRPSLAPMMQQQPPQHQQQQQQQQQQQHKVVQSIFVDPDNSVASSSGCISYVDQLCHKKLSNTSVGQLSSEHATVNNGSRSSGFTSPSTVDIDILPPPKRSFSPLPNSVANKLNTKSYERNVVPCKPGMYRFFMEQHIDTVIRYCRERQQRANQLINEMEEAKLTPQLQDKMIRLLRQRESKYLRLQRQKVNKKMFDIIQHIGVGAFGKVALVRKRDNNQIYAMKILSKETVIQKQQLAHVKAERDILAEAFSEWIVKLYFSFQDSHNLYFIMEYVHGGDMMQLLIVKGIFSEKLARFYTAELTAAIEYVHSLGFIHRDIKPDNILLDKSGHIKLTDFGLCTGFRWTHDKRRYVVYESEDPEAVNHVRNESLPKGHGSDKRNVSRSVVGTCNYMAPEVIKREGHTQLCDWWSVGVILYEMVFGRPPFMSHPENVYETQKRIINWRKFLDLTCMSHLPEPLSENCLDLIRRLCCDQTDRLGRDGAGDIKAHHWFKGMDFDTLRLTEAEFIPKVRHDLDTSNFDVSDLDAQEFINSFHKETLKPNFGKNPNFYEFTFRHFFNMEDGQMCQPARQQQRPSLPQFDTKSPTPEKKTARAPPQPEQSPNPGATSKAPAPPPPSHRPASLVLKKESPPSPPISSPSSPKGFTRVVPPRISSSNYRPGFVRQPRTYLHPHMRREIFRQGGTTTGLGNSLQPTAEEDAERI